MRPTVVSLLLLLSAACEPPAEAPLRPASTAPAPVAPPPEVGTAEAPSIPEARLPLDPTTRFLGEPEQAVRQALATRAIARIEKGRGGRSLAFKITLDDGTEGYFKPEQTFSAAHYYAELASYYLDRELGLGRVPPTIGRRLPWAPLREIAGRDERTDEILVAEDGTVRGAFIWWIPERLERLAPGRGWDRWVRVGGPVVATPYQRPAGWSERRPDPDQGATEREPDTVGRPGELSDMILFDYLTTNVDRWGGEFTNVRTREPGGPLIYLDNGAGFTAGPSARIPLMDARLAALQRFRRPTVEAIRALDRARLERRMAEDPLDPFLGERHLTQLLERREQLLAHVSELEARFGDRIWLDPL